MDPAQQFHIINDPELKEPDIQTSEPEIAADLFKWVDEFFREYDRYVSRWMSTLY